MSGAPAAAPPAEGGATLQGQLRALSARVLARARHDAGVSSSAELSSDAPSETSRAVGRLQRRALEVLLRFDEDVPVADLDPAERAERNALRLGAAALSMRARGARADADRLESLHDAFVTRRTAVLRATASASQIEPLEEHAATLALLLSLANTGGDLDVATGCVRARTVTSDVAETKMSARAARAAAWLRLDSTIRFDVVDATGFGAGPVPDDGSRAPHDAFTLLSPRLDGSSTNARGRFGDDDDDVREALLKKTGGGGSARFKPLARLDAAPAPLRLGAARRPNDENESLANVFADPLTFPTRSDSEDPHDPSRSLFGALRRARVPAAFDERDALAIRVAIRDEPFGTNRGGLASVARGGDFDGGDFAYEPAPEGTRDKSAFAAESKKNASVAERKRNADAERTCWRTPETAREEDDPWLAAAAADGDGPNRRTSSATEVFGWDEADENSGEKGTRRQRHAPACDAFLAGGEAAFGDAYGTFVRPEARLFGAATPARATQEELVQATRRALAGQRAAAHALVPAALAHDAPRGARDPPPLRLPAASAGSVAGALRALADAAEDRAALDAFVRRAEAESDFGEGEENAPRMDLAARAAASAARDVLRAHDAALLALPAAAAARRAAERAADEACDPRERTAWAYRVEPNGKSIDRFLSDDSDSPNAGVTLLEARAHTRALRAQLAAMRLLCAPANEEMVTDSSTLRRALGALAAGGARDAGERNLLRRLAAAAAAPALAQARVWTRRAAVADDPRGEFFVRVSEGWGASANELALSPAEASVEAWRVRALERALEPDSDADEREELLFVSKVESDAGDASDADRLELAELPPWRGGPPGRARELAGGAPPEERASLRDDFSRTGTHLLFAGAERDALALGVHLRILQRLPQTASFAAAVASLDETLEVEAREKEALSSAKKTSGGAWRPWTLAFDAEALAEATARGRQTSLALRALARRTLDAMASTRDAEKARAEARRRARNAAETARRLEKDAATAAAKETLLEDFARRMASLAARRAREAYARRALRASGRESLLSALEEPLPEGEGEARRKKEDENDEASIRAALEEALDVARRLATPGSATPETPPRDAAAEGSAPVPASASASASASRRDAPSPSHPTSPIGSSPDAYFRALRRSRDGGETGSPLDVSADASDLEASFRTARSEGGELNEESPGPLDEAALAPSTPSGSGIPIPIAGDPEGERLVPASQTESVDNAREGIYPDSLDDDDSEGDSPEGDFQDGAFETRKSRDAEPELKSKTKPEREREPVLEIPLAALVDRCVSGPIRDARAVVASLVARTFLEHLGLETHCASMRAFLLCGAGDFASALAERVADAAARARVAGACQGAAPAAFLRDALESARLQSSACDEPLARRWRLRSRAPPKADEASYSASYKGVRDAAFSEHSAGMVDFLEASYELEWPLGVLFPSATRTTLAEAHRQMLRLRHVSLALAEAHARVHEAGRAHRGSLRSRARDDDDAFGGVAGRLLADRRLRRLSLLSHELRHFVAAVEASAGEECHGAARAALEKSFFEDADGRNGKNRSVRARDAYALRAAAAAYATRCASACFLSVRDAPLREAVDVALQLALDFRKATRAASTDKASASSLLTDGSTYASVQATHARFRVAARRLCVCLRDAAADRGGALGGVEPRRAAELLERLDHNGFYLRS